jgi:hypothetical protein
MRRTLQNALQLVGEARGRLRPSIRRGSLVATLTFLPTWVSAQNISPPIEVSTVNAGASVDCVVTTRSNELVSAEVRVYAVDRSNRVRAVAGKCMGTFKGKTDVPFDIASRLAPEERSGVRFACVATRARDPRTIWKIAASEEAIGAHALEAVQKRSAAAFRYTATRSKEAIECSCQTLDVSVAPAVCRDGVKVAACRPGQGFNLTCR